jgi:hypothetical protein
VLIFKFLDFAKELLRVFPQPIYFIRSRRFPNFSEPLKEVPRNHHDRSHASEYQQNSPDFLKKTAQPTAVRARRRG